MLSDQEIQKYILHTGTTWKTANKKKKGALGTCPTHTSLESWCSFEDMKT